MTTKDGFAIIDTDEDGAIPARFMDGTPIHKVRKEVLEFALAMEAKLRKNDHKTSWKDQPVEAHIKLLKIEMMEFEVALEFLGLEEACKECIDIGNFAMIIRNKIMSQGKEAFRGQSGRVLWNPDEKTDSYNPAWTQGEL